MMGATGTGGISVEVWKTAGMRETAVVAAGATPVDTAVGGVDAVARGGVRSLSKKVFFVGRKILLALSVLTGVLGVDGRGVPVGGALSTT